ncbi:MAG: hypothetical protein IT518_12360 [Burkholderiales bacterium]|nr:hypothetical protein [Burkholderiales bacterium]
MKLVPDTAAAMPEVSPDGRTWRIRIRPGIYFTDDPAFKGRRRELVADDYVFAWKRVLDPRVRSTELHIFDGRFVGAEEVLAKARESGKFDYDAPIEGLQSVDRYTLKLELNCADSELLSNLTTPASAEVVPMALARRGAESMKRPRRNHSAKFKAAVALAAIRGEKTLVELAEQYKVHANQIGQWRLELLQRAAEVFATAAEKRDAGPDLKSLHAKIGQQGRRT